MLFECEVARIGLLLVELGTDLIANEIVHRIHRNRAKPDDPR